MEAERTLTLLTAGTGLRISECLALQWQDVDFANQRIHVRRTWVHGRMGTPKTKRRTHPRRCILCWQSRCNAGSRSRPTLSPVNWVFPSMKLKGRKPRCANTLVEDYLRPAAVKAGVLTKDDSRRFGYHNLRHSLASFLVRTKTDVKTVQNLLRHSNVKTTLQVRAA